MANYVAPYVNGTLPEHGIIGRGYALVSKSGQVSFRVTNEGNLLLVANGKKLWSVEGKNASFVAMQADGNCCGYTPDGVAMWATQTNGSNHPYALVCQDDGNLVVYAKGGRPVWATDTGGLVPPAPPAFVAPYGDTLPESGIIGRGYCLRSKSKRVEFRVENNGNLVLLGDGRKLWSVEGKNASFVAMQGDGNCCGYTCSGVPIWAAQTNGTNHPYILVCQDDGNLVVYANGRPVWASNTNVIR